MHRTPKQRNHPTPKKQELSCLQVNLGRSRNALQELSVHLHKNKTDLVFVTEPYTWSSDTMKNIAGYASYQFPAGTHTKALILVRENTVSTLGSSEYSTSNLSIVKINSRNKERLYLISVYVEPRIDQENTLGKLEVFLHKTAGSKHLITRTGVTRQRI